LLRLSSKTYEKTRILKVNSQVIHIFEGLNLKGSCNIIEMSVSDVWAPCAGTGHWEKAGN